MKQQFLSTTNRFVVLDNFLREDHLPPLRTLMLEQAEFKANLKLKTSAQVFGNASKQERRGRVDEALFEASRDDEKFISQWIFDRPKRGMEHEPPFRTHKLISRVLGLPGMYRWLEAISDQQIRSITPINLKAHGAGHFLHKHQDKTGGRQLCAVLYLHEHWEEDFGGHFILHLHDGSEHKIAPMPGRLILFDASVTNFHEIEPLGNIPEGWLRLNYSFWYL